MLGRGEGDQDEATGRTNDATHFQKGGEALRRRQHVEEITGKHGVKGIIRIREGRGVSLSHPMSIVVAPGHPPTGTGEESRRQIQPFGPSGGIGNCQSFQGPSGAGSHVQHPFAVTNLDPREGKRSGSGGNERDERIVERGEEGVRGPELVGVVLRT